MLTAGTAALGMGLLFLAIIILLLLGIRVGLALACIAFVGLWFGIGRFNLDGVGLAFYDSINSLALTAIPLFVLMGDFLLRAGFIEDVYRIITTIFRRVPGGCSLRKYCREWDFCHDVRVKFGDCSNNRKCGCTHYDKDGIR